MPLHLTESRLNWNEDDSNASANDLEMGSLEGDISTPKILTSCTFLASDVSLLVDDSFSDGEETAESLNFESDSNSAREGQQSVAEKRQHENSRPEPKRPAKRRRTARGNYVELQLLKVVKDLATECKKEDAVTETSLKQDN